MMEMWKTVDGLTAKLTFGETEWSPAPMKANARRESKINSYRSTGERTSRDAGTGL